ncbi:GNAT family N-acetyltransferase [Bizionia myxarmorum]|uniref:GNAT family N-acetyltransferase n=1 Tax=Bizionia myxarmorum TaxID=291186 RepID=A0A5D0R6C4_9FLAO|nr:GNAT family protein [Bizionia myxarmorum]TYB76411.1 GNAT family N-acetyltransferase [Bizionia myxarmorum]
MNNAYFENNYVKLTLLDLSNYKYLTEIAEEKDLIFYAPNAISPPGELREYVQNAIEDYINKTAIPFIIYDKRKQAYAGSTRFGLINYKNKVLHIGWTWIGKDFQGTGLNKNIKFLMLQYAFETLAFDKVEFRIDERNMKSRKAVEKIGATLEGILRKDTLMLDGFKRSTCCFGILKEEWLHLKNTIFAGFK